MVPSAFTVSTTSYDVMRSLPVLDRGRRRDRWRHEDQATASRSNDPHRRSMLSRSLPLLRRDSARCSLPLGLLLGERLAACRSVRLPRAERDLDLGLAVLEVQRERDHRDAALLGLADQPHDLLPVQQQLALAPRLVVGPGALGVLRDVHAGQPHLAVADVREAVDQRGVPRAQRLDLGAGEHQPGLVDVVDVVVVARLAVLRDQLAALLLGHQPRPVPPSAATSPVSTSMARRSATSGGCPGRHRRRRARRRPRRGCGRPG